LTTIHAAPIVGPLLGVCLGLIAIPQVRRRLDVARRHPVTLAILTVYGATVVAVTTFPIILWPPEHWLGEPWWTVIHWIPFYVDAPSFVLNVIMMEPFGVLLPLLWPATGSVRRIALWSLLARAAIELSQLVLGLTLGSRRTVDINDLIANVGGAVVGLLVLRIVAVFRPGLVPSADRPDQA
jgi:glycopeptide antibiotics resistance protein